jgi:S1-C subfamily serine protease
VKRARCCRYRPDGRIRLLSVLVLVFAHIAASPVAALAPEGTPSGNDDSAARGSRLTAALPASAEVGALSAEALYNVVSPAVVAITCHRFASLGGRREVYFGTGAIIDPSGLILTSVTVLPEGAREIRAYLRGGRVARAELLLHMPELEVSVARLAGLDQLVAAGGGAVPYLELGDSDAVEVGDAAFSLGNAFHSIERDDQVTIAAGVVSGRFGLREKRSESTYLGPAIETSAALNNGMDGGPLVNARGEIIGLLSLNYSLQRWLGTAVPVNALKTALGRHRGWFDDRRQGHAAFVGCELFDHLGAAARVARVRPGSPAEAAGLRPRDLVTSFRGADVRGAADFDGLFQGSRPGERVKFEVERDGKTVVLECELGRRF